MVSSGKCVQCEAMKMAPAVAAAISRWEESEWTESPAKGMASLSTNGQGVTAEERKEAAIRRQVQAREEAAERWRQAVALKKRAAEVVVSDGPVAPRARISLSLPPAIGRVRPAAAAAVGQASGAVEVLAPPSFNAPPPSDDSPPWD